jgi:exodeoxyribonuclease V alpha subunit
VEPINGVYNGEQGIVLCKRGGFIIVLFDNKIAAVPYIKSKYLQRSYALTVHKAQGSEYEGVVVLVAWAYFVLLTHEVYYTALSRAKNKLVLIGEDSAFFKAMETRETLTELKRSKLYEFFTL